MSERTDKVIEAVKEASQAVAKDTMSRDDAQDHVNNAAKEAMGG